MRACLYGFGAIILLVGTIGCAMGRSDYDGTYAAYGGSQPRTNMTTGRVGSRFHPSGGEVEAAPEPTADLPTYIEPQTDIEESDESEI